MPKRITITPHLPVEDLERRYRQAKDAIERSHYQIIWLLGQGKRSEEVAAVTGYSRHWIYELVRSYNRLGAAARCVFCVIKIRVLLCCSMMFAVPICCRHCEVLPLTVGYGMGA